MALRVIAATNYGASAAFHPATESMDFGRPLYASEALCVCLIQLVTPGRTYPADTVQVSAHLLDVALQELDWVAAAADATRCGLEQTLRLRLEHDPHQAYSDDAWPRTPCPYARRIELGTLAVGDDCLEVLDLV